MPNVTDQDYCSASDGGEREFAPQVIVTGGSLTDDGGNPAQGLVEFDAGKVLVTTGEGGAARVWDNPVITQVYQGVMFAVALPDSQLAFPATFTYTITMKIEGSDEYQVSGVTISRNIYPSGLCGLSQLI